MSLEHVCLCVCVCVVLVVQVRGHGLLNKDEKGKVVFVCPILKGPSRQAWVNLSRNKARGRILNFSDAPTQSRQHLFAVIGIGLSQNPPVSYHSTNDYLPFRSLRLSSLCGSGRNFAQIS
jgi:hypothetical protein